MLNKKREASRHNGDVHLKHTLSNQRDIAKRAGDLEEVTRINAQLVRMSERSASASTALQPVAVNGGSPAKSQTMSLDERRKNLAASLGTKAKASAQNSR